MGRVCVCMYKCQRFLQQEKMRENVPAIGTSRLLTFFFSVTKCNLFISVACMSMGQGGCSCHRTDARLSVGGKCRTAGKGHNRGQEALAGKRCGRFF